MNDSLKIQLDNSIKNDIKKLYNKVDGPTKEFEFMFRGNENMQMETFLRILEYIKYKSKAKKLDMINLNTSDISYNYKNGINYRITIDSVDAINKNIKRFHSKVSNHTVFNVLSRLSNKDPNISIMKKSKSKSDMIDIDDFDIRTRLSTEENLTKVENEMISNLEYLEMDKITFRYKQRVSLVLVDDSNVKVSLDLTNVKTSNSINKLDRAPATYELEVELTTKKKKKIDSKYLDTLYDELNVLVKLIQQSNFIVSKTTKKEVLEQYVKLLNLEKNMISLAGRKPQSLEIQHVVDKLPNRYAVTDKADGERYFLILCNNNTFLISDRLNVINTGIKLSGKQTKYNNSILDGELVFINNRYIFLCFDCLIKGNTDVRLESSLVVRHKSADEIINNCFILGKQKGYEFVEYKKKYTIDGLLKFHKDNIKSYMDNLNNDIDIEKKYLLVRRKYFCYAEGIQNNEIYKYSKQMWEQYTKDSSVNCPYILDGLVYQPIDQSYEISATKSKYIDYKWKPQDKNSIDFYVKFERDRQTNKILNLYDNTIKSYGVDEGENEFDKPEIKNVPYRIMKLYVGTHVKTASGKKEIPVLFEPDNSDDFYRAVSFLKQGNVRDMDNNIIQDGTVVEFYYKNDISVPKERRWIPIRTRYDKTEMVKRFGKKYGNNQSISYKIWRSIKNPFRVDDISLLASDRDFDNHMDVLRKKIDHSTIVSEAKENVYFQKVTNLGKPMRNFQNWIKSILIYTYVNSNYVPSGKQLTVLDISCGRGGDLMRFYYGKVKFYVGFDIDNAGLVSPVNGAISRYMQHRKTHPNFPPMYFIQADGGVPLNYEDQYKALGGMSAKNKHLMEKYFNNNMKYDRLSCQFAVHYFFKNDTVLNNFMKNINDYLIDDGYIVITTFDADRIMEKLKGKNNYTEHYVDDKGNKTMLFDIVKKYSEPKKNQDVSTGYAIDFYNALIFQEGFYMTEYLVQKDFITKQMDEKCNMELVDTELFENLYNMHREYFVDGYYKYEDSFKTRNFLKDVAAFYTNKDDINKASFKLSKLYRYYVFRKRSTNNKTINKTTKTKQVGGGVSKLDGIAFNKVVEYMDPTKFVITTPNNLEGYSFLDSIYEMLVIHGLIPKNVSLLEFLNDINYDYNDCSDSTLTSRNILDFNNCLKIKHFDSSKNKSSLILDSLNIYVVQENNVFDLYSPTDNTFVPVLPIVMVYYDGTRYYPIYRFYNRRYIALYNKNMNFIKNILKLH